MNLTRTLPLTLTKSSAEGAASSPADAGVNPADGSCAGGGSAAAGGEPVTSPRPGGGEAGAPRGDAPALPPSRKAISW